MALLIVVLVITAIVIFEPFRSEPPAPKITVNGEDIPTTQGSYCWNGLLFAQCVDFIYSTPLEMAEKHTPTKVMPKEKIKVDFKKEPDSRKIELWTSETEIKNISLKDDFFYAPEEKGVYVYHISSWWKQGDGNDAFWIEVQ